MSNIKFEKINKLKIMFAIILLILSFPMYATEIFENECEYGICRAAVSWSSGSIASTTYSSSNTINLSGSVTLTGTITVNSGVTLTIQGAGTITRGSSNKAALFKINDGGKLIIKGTTGNNNDIVINGNKSKVTATSPVIDCYEKLDLTNVTIKNNSNSGNTAGGINIQPKDVNVSMTNCVIDGCYSPAGSAIYLKGSGSGPVNITKTIIQNCTTEGGTIRTNGGGNWQLTVQESVVRNNYSNGFGGAFYWNSNGSSAKLQITDVHIIGNEATDRGGGLFLEGSKMVLSSSTGNATEALATGNIPTEGIVGTLVQDNISGTYGGGLYISGYGGGADVGMSSTDSFNLNLTENVVLKNNSAPNGGAIGLNLAKADPADGYTYNVIIDGAEIIGNIADEDGGAIYCKLNYNKYNVNITMEDGNVFDNHANNGSAFYVAGGIFKMNGGILSENIATGDGGAIYVTNSSYDNGSKVYEIGCKFTMTGGELIDNSADGNGGAIYLSGGDFIMSNGTISSNIAEGNGGGVYVSGGDFSMSNGIITENEANLNGGGIFAGSTDKNIKVEIAGGEISLNKASQHGGALDVNMASGYTAEVIIGVEACKGKDTSKHAINASCPNLAQNRALESGGGFCIHGDTDKVTVNMYCGELQNNVAVKNTASGNMNQTGGTFIISGGDLGNNIILLGGEFIDLRENIQHITIRYHSNYDDGTAETYIDTKVVVGSIINLPGDVYTRDSHILSGWTTSLTNEINGYMPVNASYEIVSIDDECLDLYAVWDAEYSYIIIIPAEIDMTDSNDATITIEAELSYFTEAASLEVNIKSENEFKLTNAYVDLDSIDYELYLDGASIDNDSVVAEFKYNNTEDVIIESRIDEIPSSFKYAGDYKDILTFTVKYDDGLS